MKVENRNPLVGITTGDPNGVGCELIIKTFQDERILELLTPVVFGSPKLILTYLKILGLNLKFNEITDLKKVAKGRLNIINISETLPEINLGKPDKTAGLYAIKSLEAAVKSLKDKDIDTLVTAPINKQVSWSESFKFTGHTDYIQSQLQGKSLMFMISDELRVGLLTDHIPLREVVPSLTTELIESKINILHESLIKDFGIEKPKLAVLSINPHSGDNGLIGDEDQKLLSPVISKLFDQNKIIFGPYPADGFFGAQKYKNFDAIISPYHDQGLLAFKTLTFGQGVNFTAGMNRIRTSPDHGTAYDIAGTGRVDNTSFREAIYKAIDIFRCREKTI